MLNKQINNMGKKNGLEQNGEDKAAIALKASTNQQHYNAYGKW